MARPRKSAVTKPVSPAQAPAQQPVRAPEAAAEVRKTRAPLPPPGELRKMIETAAYFRGQKDGFRMDPGLYWNEAEKEILSRYK